VFALIIAIDKYQHDAIPNLHGCVNDGEYFQRFLKDSLHVPSSNILRLVNESATRDNILSAFDGYLINNERIGRDDLVFVFYAGYGDRIDAPADWPERKKVETICPYDQSAFEGLVSPKCRPIYGIPDRTFNALMDQLAEKKGNNLVCTISLSAAGIIFKL
ncbi:peptidase C14, caspase domain-containing protein, partial [Fomitopsis serialis]|uniref:peptidase C14, caspase domain-containing protein n=1 Tax=Fomitopsis serialis TaxID=139415 RepID=UPI002007E7EB